MTEHPRLFVVGYYGFKNLGDEAILASMMRGFGSAVPGAQVVVTSGDPVETKARHGVGAVHWRDIPAIAGEVAASDLVILGGGGLFLDFWGCEADTLLTRDHWGLPFFAGPAVMAALEGKPLFLYGVGVESLSTPQGRQMTGAIFDLSWAATVRDDVSAGYAAELGVDPGRIEVTADPVFDAALDDSLFNTGIHGESGADGADTGPTVGVALRSWTLGGDSEKWVAEVATAVETFVIRHDGRAMLIPFQALEKEGEYDDRKLASSVASRFGDRDRVEVTKVPADAAQAASILASCDIVLGMRYHAILLAAVVGKPLVALEYAPKVRGLMKQLGASRFGLAMEAIDSTTIGTLLEEAWQTRGDLGDGIRGVAEKLALAAEKNNRVVRDLLQGTISPPEPTRRGRALVAEGAVAAVLRVEKRTSEALALARQRDGLIDQRDGLKGERDALQGERDALQGERDALQGERDALQGERDALEADRNRLIDEKTVLVEERKHLAEANADLERRLAELERVHGELQELFNRITSTRSYRAMSAVWSLRGNLARIPRAVRGFFSRPTKEDRRGTASSSRSKLQSWEAFLLDRHRREIMARFGDDFPARGERRERGTISVIILANDGYSALGRTIESVRSQSYLSLQVLVGLSNEAIAENPAIARAIAADERVQIIDGGAGGEAAIFWSAIRQCGGEFICWLQSGDVLAEGVLDKMVRTLARHPRCGAVSSEIAALGEEPYEDTGGGVVPIGESGGPSDLRVLNIEPPTRPALILLCRRQVLDFLAAIEGAGRAPFLTDLVMRINELFTVGRVSSKTPLASRTSSSPEETGKRPAAIPEDLERLAVFDDFRRHFLLGPVLWSVTGLGDDGRRLAESLKTLAAGTGDLLIDDERLLPPPDSRLWLPCAAVTVAGKGSTGIEPEEEDVSVFKALVEVGEPEGEAPPDWDLAVAIGRSDQMGEGSDPARGWWSVNDVADAVRLVDLAALTHQLGSIEVAMSGQEPGNESLDATVIVCTHQPIAPLEGALASLAGQDIAPDRFEVILVNNNPEDSQLRAVLDGIIEEHFSAGPIELREVPCPIKGLSAARNTGIAAARGDVLLFLDDDATAPTSWVAEAVRLFREHPDTGVIGGSIRLAPPDPLPEVLQPGWGRYWSELLPDEQGFHLVEKWWDFPWGASWCARRSVLFEIGGFRSRFGRTRGDFAGGEEVVAAALAQRLGWKIARAPELEVAHHVVADRYTWRHVRKTIRAGTLGNYRAQREMYIPMDGIRWTIRCLLSPGVDRTVGAHTIGARLRHWSYRKIAWLHLLQWQVADELKRRRRPVLGRRCG